MKKENITVKSGFKNVQGDIYHFTGLIKELDQSWKYHGKVILKETGDVIDDITHQASMYIENPKTGKRISQYWRQAADVEEGDLVTLMCVSKGDGDTLQRFAIYNHSTGRTIKSPPNKEKAYFGMRFLGYDLMTRQFAKIVRLFGIFLGLILTAFVVATVMQFADIKESLMNGSLDGILYAYIEAVADNNNSQVLFISTILLGVIGEGIVGRVLQHFFPSARAAENTFSNLLKKVPDIAAKCRSEYEAQQSL